MAFQIGLIVNPVAGLGGSVALKGSDDVADLALAKGAVPRAGERTLITLNTMKDLDIALYGFAGDLGAVWAEQAGLDYTVVGEAAQTPSQASDTIAAAHQLAAMNVDLILFAGGDGTARDILDAIGANSQRQIPVVGIPAGVKIHSGVYAISPLAAGKVVMELVSGQLVSLRSNEVRDIDEQAFREGRVQSQYYGELLVPVEHQYMQATKSSTGKEDERLALDDIADHVVENMYEDVLYIMGSGSTVAAVMARMGLPNTLLGVDLVRNNELVASDLTAAELLAHCHQAQSDQLGFELVITLIGGQGHIIGRGNQQISVELIRLIGLKNIHILATKTKLASLEGRPMLMDSGDPQLDEEWRGLVPVICGYNDKVLYPLGVE